MCVEIKKRGRERGDDMGSVTMYLLNLVVVEVEVWYVHT